GAVQRAHHAVLVAGQLEDQLDLHAAAAGRAGEAERVVRPADRGRAVDRPADRFQDRALPRAVRADDPGEPAAELDGGVRVLAEVLELDPDQPHPRPTLPRVPRPARPVAPPHPLPPGTSWPAR